VPFRGDDVIRAIRDGRCRRPSIERLGDFRYFVDAEGSVYSLNGEQPRVIEPKIGTGGLEWVCLATQNGWEQFIVGELVALAFMLDSRPCTDEDWTVEYRDLDSRNHRVGNLRWITRIEAQQQRQYAAPATEPAAPMSTACPDPEVAASRAPETAASDERVLTMIDRLARVQQQHAQLQQRYALALDALRPFATLRLAAEPRYTHADTVLVDGGHDAGAPSRITVADFQKAAETLRRLDGG
jgi:hypothetical protein